MDSKMIASGLLLAAVFLASLHSNAQENESRIDAETLRPIRSALLSVDAAPILLGGFGLGADFSPMEKSTIGLFYSQAKPKNLLDGLFTEAESDLKIYGARARFYLNRTFSESGWYVGAAAVKAEIKVKARSTFLGNGPWATGTKEQTGAQGSLGYQFIGRSLGESGQFSFNLAYIYGAGNNFGYEYDSKNSQATVTPILENGSGLEATLGWMF